jgi:hypothetical protein
MENLIKGGGTGDYDARIIKGTNRQSMENSSTK